MNFKGKCKDKDKNKHPGAFLNTPKFLTLLPKST